MTRFSKALPFLMLTLLGPALLFAQTKEQPGIRGRLKDQSNGQEVSGATLVIKETGQGAQTGADGSFRMVIVPGNYTLEVKFIGYKTLSRKIFVPKGAPLTLDLKLSTISTLLKGVNVEASRPARTEKSMLELRRKSAVIQDAISAEQIEKTASITTAQALQRVTGVSLRDGKYIAVRGLSDRNLVVQLNGARLSGADASRSSVALDLIPAPLLDNITVEKSVTPDKPGDATGAVVEIKTKSIPDSSFTQLTVETGFNSNIGPLGYYNSFGGANLGAFGQNVQHLNVPLVYRDLIGQYTARGFSVQQGTLRGGLAAAIADGNIDDAHYKESQRINSAVREFPTTLTTRAEKARLDQIINFSHGNRYPFKNGNVLGVVFGVNYYQRFLANPNGENNRYSLPGIAGPNIIFPNELDLLPLFTQSERAGTREISYGGIATIAYRFNQNHEISGSFNANFGAEATATYLEGQVNSTLKPSDPTQVPPLQNRSRSFEYVLRTTERPLQTFQLKGEHRFLPFGKEPWRLLWNASSSHARQNDPDYRDTQLILDSLGRSTKNGAGRQITTDYRYGFNLYSTRYWRELRETNQNYKFDLIIPFTKSAHPLQFKTGAYYFSRRRAYKESTDIRKDSTILAGQNTPLLDPVTGLADPTTGFQGSRLGAQNSNNIVEALGNLDVWSAKTTGTIPGVNTLQGSSPVAGYIPVPRAGPNNYTADVKILAFYGMLDWQLSKSLRLIGGMRIENTDFKARPDTVGSGFPVKGLTAIRRPILVDTQEEFEKLYGTNYLTYTWLPSGSIIYSGLKNKSLRIAYSKTITRPEINEIVSSSQYDPLQRASILGNTHLENGEFRAYDFRFDWFPRPEELVSASLYYKKVTHQIERVYLPSFGGIDRYGNLTSTISFRNNSFPGYVYGLEFEIRKKLDQLFPLGKYVLLGANILLARSTTQVDPIEQYTATIINRRQANTRPIIDQPNYVVNFNAGFDYPVWGTNINLLYNRTGKRLVEINVDGTPNLYEFPSPTLDLIVSQRLTKKLVIKGFAKNITNEYNFYYYLTPANSLTYGIHGYQYIRRKFSQGAAYTFGLTYTF